MNLYENCLSLTHDPRPILESEVETVTLARMGDDNSTRPSFIKVDQNDWRAQLYRRVFYISDLHLVEHILMRFSKEVTDAEIRDYIHGIVLQLFDGDFGEAIKSFRNPIVLFAGDISSSFRISELFFRDFIDTWKQKADESFAFYSSALFPMKKRLTSAEREYDVWKEKNSWFLNARKPIEEYSEKKVPTWVKELDATIRELESQIAAKHQELGIDHSWEEAYRITKKHPFIYTVLGNHELWDFNSLEDCVEAYKSLYGELGIVFLNNDLYYLGPHEQPFRYNKINKAQKYATKALNRRHSTKEIEDVLITSDSILIVGGLGYASMNPSFNAINGIYRSAINRETELKKGEEWKNQYQNAVKIAKENHCTLVVLSHNPTSDWLDMRDHCTNCFFFSGHTHRNIAYSEEGNVYLFADNQVGYNGKNFQFKKVLLHLPRNPFADDPDGFREINCTELKEYYHFVLERIPGTGKIEEQIERFGAKIFVIKQDGYVGFFLSTPRGIYICNGGQIRKIGEPEELDRYAANFKAMVEKYITALTPLRRLQEQVSAYIQSFGGEGKIHGTIVDIDFYNHVMVNTNNGSLVYYNSPVFGVGKRYSNIRALLHAQCPELEEKLVSSGKAELAPIAEGFDDEAGVYEHVDIKNSPYALSRRVNALQRLFDKRILRDWNPDLEVYKKAVTH